MNKIEPESIGEWWKTLPEEYKSEARIVLDCLSDNDDPRYVWLQLLTGYFGARFVKAYISLILKES